MRYRIYHHLGKAALRDWYAVHITGPDENGTKRVAFASKIHVGKLYPLTFSFADTFTDNEILKDHDVITRFTEMFGADAFVGSIRI